ncbi:hypothetical protein TrVFT333_006163 [Trichoderma virens FT-333]|nr:hypothetical protein TrVFT333_006163 [Trichoderma virens FT-333]
MASITANMKLIVLLASVVVAQVQTPIRPSYDSAKANANHIFNAIHSAGRQWGSSLNHNGFGFIPVVVPAGISLYHGGYFEQPPEGPEWLAFEVEHAENFARVPKGGPRGSLCDLITEWGWDGIMRMEIGFEVIYCNFSSGLNLDSSIRTLVPEDRLEDDFSLIPYLWSRAATERYDGLGGDRIQMDFSSMVSGFFFPINISNTDPDRPDLIRLRAAQREHLLDIKNYIQTLFVEPRKFIVNWQAVVDMIIARFGNRLAAMASTSVSTDLFIGELEGTVLTYLEAPSLPGDVTMAEDDDGRNRTAEAIDRCASHYLKPALPSQQDWTLSDSLIHTALGTVTQHICSNLYLIRSILLQASPDAAPDAYLIKRGVKSADMEEAVNQTRTIVRDLMQDLAWTTWKKPQLCVEGQILLTAMWPLGDSVDHFNPGCVPAQDITGRRRNYWTPYEKRPRVD